MCFSLFRFRPFFFRLRVLFSFSPTLWSEFGVSFHWCGMAYHGTADREDGREELRESRLRECFRNPVYQLELYVSFYNNTQPIVFQLTLCMPHIQKRNYLFVSYFCSLARAICTNSKYVHILCLLNGKHRTNCNVCMMYADFGLNTVFFLLIFLLFKPTPFRHTDFPENLFILYGIDNSIPKTKTISHKHTIIG